MTKGMFDDLFGENGQNLTEAQRKEAQRKKTKEEYEYVSGGVAYKPYDRLIALSQGERTGGVADQMLVEANRLRQAGYTDVYREFGLTEAYEKVTKWGTSFIVGTGKALQPLAAPQQIFFGNVGGLTDLVQGDVKGAMKTWGRGMNAAIGFATYGKLNGEKRDQAIWGKELANDWGIKGTAGAVTGGLMDFFADPLLLAGVVGKAGSLARAGKLGDMLTPGSRVAAMGDAEALLGGVSLTKKPVADIFQAATSMVDVVNNVSAGAIKNPAAFRRAAGEILQNPLQTTRSIPGLFSDDAKYAGTPWATIRENLDAAGAVEGALSFANAVARIPSSKAPLKQAWQAIPLSARMAMGQGVGSLVEGARFVPLMMGNATTSGLTVAESIISRWGTIPGIPEVNIAKLKETGKSYGAGVSRVLQESFRQRQIEAANMGLRATDLTSRYAKITGKMDETTKKGFDHFSSKVLDAKDPAALITAWRDFETFTGAHNVTEIGADFLRRVTDYDVYGATVRARLGLESQSGVHSYEAGRDLLNMIVRGEFDKAQDIVNQWQDYMVNPAFQNVMVRGYTDITDDTGKVIGQRPRYNPVIGGNSPATPLGQKVQRTLLGNKVAPVAPVAALPTEQFSPILNAAETKTPELTDWNKAIMELPQSARASDIRSASVFGGDPASLSSTKIPENLKSTQDFMDEVVPLLDERMGPDVARVAADEVTPGKTYDTPSQAARLANAAETFGLTAIGAENIAHVAYGNKGWGSLHGPEAQRAIEMGLPLPDGVVIAGFDDTAVVANRGVLSQRIAEMRRDPAEAAALATFGDLANPEDYVSAALQELRLPGSKNKNAADTVLGRLLGVSKEGVNRFIAASDAPKTAGKFWWESPENSGMSRQEVGQGYAFIDYGNNPNIAQAQEFQSKMDAARRRGDLEPLSLKSQNQSSDWGGGDPFARPAPKGLGGLRAMPSQDEMRQIVAYTDAYAQSSGLGNQEIVIDKVRELMGKMNLAQFDEAADYIRSQLLDPIEQGGFRTSRESERAVFELAVRVVRKEIAPDATGLASAPKTLSAQFPKNMARYKALTADEEANIRRVQSVLYMDEMKIRDADMGGADIPAELVPGLSPFRATYVENGITYVKPEPPQLIRGDDGGIYVRTGDDQVMKVVTDSEGKLYGYGGNIANSSKRKKTAFVDESDRPLDPSVQPNVGGGREYIALGAIRNDPAAIMEGYQLGVLDDQLDQGRETAEWLAKKSNDDFNAAAGLQDSWEAQVNSIFDSKLIDEIKPVNFSPDKVQAYDNASKGWPPNNPENFTKPDGTLDMETVGRLREQFPGWDIFKPMTKNSDYDNALFFHGGRPPGDNLFAGNPRDYAQATGLGGKGIYLTDWDGMAGNYGRGSSSFTREMGNIYAVRLGKGQKLLDMDALPSDPQSLIRRSYKYLMENQADDVVTGLKAERDAILKLISDGKITNGFDLLNSMRYGENIGVTPVATSVIPMAVRADAWHDAMLDRGYTGMRHVGGMRLGNGDDLHNVVILLGNGREFAPKAVLNRKQLAMYDANTGELVRRNDPMGDPLGDQKTGMAKRSSQKGASGNEGINVSLRSTDGKSVSLNRVSKDSSVDAAISLDYMYMDRIGPEEMARRMTSVLAEMKSKGINEVKVTTRIDPGFNATPIYPSQQSFDDFVSLIPGATSTRTFIDGAGNAEFRFTLGDNIYADPDAVFGPHGYRKNFGTEADLKGGLSSTKADYGRQTSTTENPFAPVWADRQPNSWNWDERLGAQTHLRRMFMASENPERVIRAIDQQRAAAVMFDTDRLERAMLRALVANNKNDVTAREFAEQFQKAWSDPDVAPIDQLTDFFKAQGLTGESLKNLLTEVNNDVWKLGIDYRPPGKELARQMHEYLAGTSMVGPSSGPLQNATSRAAEKSRADLAPHWQEALMQIDDIGEAIAKNSEVNEKVISRRGMVQDMYTFLKSEGGIIPKSEVTSLTSRQGWFTITQDLHTQMKGLRAENAGIGDDLPFQVGDMIPAAYGQALFSAVTTAKPGMAQAVLQYLNARWKQAKLANPATIARDIGSNFAIAEGMGISPIQLTRGLGMMGRLYADSIKAGRGFVDLVDDMAEVTLKNGVKVSMRSMSEAGDFIHSGMLANEVTEPLTRLARELGNPVGNSFQRTVAAFQKYGQDVRRIREQGGVKGAALGVASVASQVAGVPGSAIQKLSDLKGKVDMFHKGAVYLLKLEEGLSPAKAAAYADEVFFNYQNVPYAVDFLRRSAISPFAAWQFLSAGRLIKTMYENPYAIHRLYRIPGSIRQGVGEQEYDDEARARSQYMRNSLWLPAVEAGGENGFRIRRDKEGRSSWFNFGAMLPEQSTADLFLNGPGGLFSQAASPTIEMLAGLVSGQGFRGMSLYPGGGNLDESMRSAQPIRDRTKEEAARTLYRFGMTPWAPGQPMMERIMDSIEYTRQDYIVHPGAEKFMRLIEDYYRDGPVVNAVQAATPSDNYRQELSTAYRQPPLELRNTIVAMFGLGISGVQPNPSKPGTMMGNYLGMQSKLKDLEAQAMREIMNATPENREAIRQTYRKEIDKLRLDLDTLRIQRSRENQTVQPADQLEF